MSVGGKRADRPGRFRPPTALTDNTTDMQMYGRLPGDPRRRAKHSGYGRELTDPGMRE